MTSTPFPGGNSGRDGGNSERHHHEDPAAAHLDGTPSGVRYPGVHPEVDELSALIEDIVSVERRKELHAHLSECELCADVHASLADIRELLGTLPGPASMPEDVSGRIDAALAAEALLDATTPGSENGAVSRETDSSASVVSRETGSSGGRPRPAAKDRPPGRAPESGGPGSSGLGRGRARRRRTVFLAAAACLVTLGLGAIALQSFTGDGSSAQVSSGKADDSARRAPGTASGSTSSPDTGGSGDDQQLRRRVQSLLSDQKTTPPAETGDTSRRPTGTPTLSTKQSPGGGESTLREDRAGGGAAVPSCVRNGIHRTEDPLAFDTEATFEGRTGYLVILPHKGGDPQRVDAYVVDPSCVRTEGAGPGKVLLKRTYPRG